jgi:hypothetical protein
MRLSRSSAAVAKRRDLEIVEEPPPIYSHREAPHTEITMRTRNMHGSFLYSIRFTRPRHILIQFFVSLHWSASIFHIVFLKFII